MKKITYDEYQEETNQLLLNHAIENNCHVDELHPGLVAHILHKRSEHWINYKYLMGELK